MALPSTYTIPPGTRSFADGSTDIVKATAELLIKQGAFTNLLSDLSEYAIVKRIMPRHKKVFARGLDWTFMAAIDAYNNGNNTAKFTGLFEDDAYNRKNVLVQGKVSPRFLTENYVYDKREPVLNSGEASKSKMLAIVEFVKLQMELMYQSAFDLLETTFAGVGPTYADDKKTPHGLAFYIQKQSNSDASSHASGGFDGKDPSLPASSSSSTPTPCPRCNISTTTYGRWANWAAQYAAVSKDDLVKKMRIASHKINFKSPLSLTDPTLSTGRDILTNLDVIQELETILEAQNMNLGNDVASKDGKVLFKGAPVEYVPVLDNDAQDPIYMIDWKTLVFGTIAGWDKKVSAPKEDNAQHNTMKGFLDMSCEMVCTNLRNQAVIAKAFS
jgi:hypothetical protein